jgi:CheY-like chemotaxis protein
MMSTPLPTLRVLYVEDHAVNVQLMQALFARRPQAKLLVAPTAAAGLALAIEASPDLLLLDLRLPDCHGTELLQRIRQHDALAHVPAVAVTAEDTGALAGRGFVEIWHKPMDLQLTLARIDRLLDDVVRLRARRVPAEAPAQRWAAAHAPRPIPFPTATR